MGVSNDYLDAPRRAQEAMEAVNLAKVFAAARKARDKIRDEICTVVCQLTGNDSANKASITTIAKAVEEFGPEKTLKWLDHAANNVGKGYPPNESKLVRYFCGILRNVRGEGKTNNET
jgi:hypothetical protein